MASRPEDSQRGRGMLLPEAASTTALGYILYSDKVTSNAGSLPRSRSHRLVRRLQSNGHNFQAGFSDFPNEPSEYPIIFNNPFPLHYSKKEPVAIKDQCD